MDSDLRSTRSAFARCERAAVALLVACCTACSNASDRDPSTRSEVAVGISLLTAAERQARAGQIRDAALASGMTQGYLLAGIADAETNMSHCWSELTWACQGPPSADCGGGPVVAGAGDGACELRQGGLGMFQFDAGTHDDTLRREGERILSIAGNVQAAVDFVVGMLIRSVYVDGVDDAAQAIEWSNGVRIENERWDPWIRTVTHYYNGCTPSASCWDTRYPYYLETTVAVHDEMGADFWQTTPEFAAEYVDQTFPLAAEPFELEPDEQSAGYIDLRNTGSAGWSPGLTLLGTTEPRDGPSPLAGPDWPSPSRAASVDREVAPGETGRFEFTLRAPSEPGEYPQFFNLVQEGVAWFGDQGGPPDDQLQVRVTVVEPEPSATSPDAAAPEAQPDADVDPRPDPDPEVDASDRATDAGESIGDGGDAGIRGRESSGCSAAARSDTTPWPMILIALSLLRILRRARAAHAR